MLVLPGGLDGAERLTQCEVTQQLIQRLAREGKYIAAICSGPIALVPHRILQGRRFTAAPSVESRVREHGSFCDQRVVIDENLITSRLPGTAMEFALALVEVLEGKEKAAKMSRGLMVSVPTRSESRPS